MTRPWSYESGGLDCTSWEQWCLDCGHFRIRLYDGNVYLFIKLIWSESRRSQQVKKSTLSFLHSDKQQHDLHYFFVFQGIRPSSPASRYFSFHDSGAPWWPPYSDLYPAYAWHLRYAAFASWYWFNYRLLPRSLCGSHVSSGLSIDVRGRWMLPCLYRPRSGLFRRTVPYPRRLSHRKEAPLH